MQSLTALEQQWGGTLAERMARRAEAWTTAHRAAEGGA